VGVSLSLSGFECSWGVSVMGLASLVLTPGSTQELC
jgi:hypothetical protein